jgi:predicted acetyltransferase
MLIELKELSLGDGNDIFKMLTEIGPGENGFMNSAYGISFEEFSEFLRGKIDFSLGKNLMPGYVPETIYWLYADCRPVGIGKLRHYLNSALRIHGGHIGYCIRPVERGKGYGTIILGELLKIARGKAIGDVLLTCAASNTPSRRVIESNNGVLESIIEGECKYWIRL